MSGKLKLAALGWGGYKATKFVDGLDWTKEQWAKARSGAPDPAKVEEPLAVEVAKGIANAAVFYFGSSFGSVSEAKKD